MVFPMCVCVCVCVCSISCFYEDWIRPTGMTSCTSLKNLPLNRVILGLEVRASLCGWGWGAGEALIQPIMEENTLDAL